jgi:DNA polymerase IV
MPMSTALRLCPHAICVRPRMDRYKEVSSQIFTIFHEVTPLVQGLSLDEAFLDVTESAALFGDAVAIARRIKQRILETTRLTASVGVAPNKLVAKIASDLDKPNGLTVVEPERVHAVLDPLPVRRLPGLGRKTGAKVETRGIQTFAQLRAAPDSVLWPLFGRYVQRIRDRAAGIDDRPVEPDREEKSISAEDTFERDVGNPRLLRTELAKLADRACERMRKKKLMARCIGIKIRRADFSTFTRRQVVAPPTHDGGTIAKVANDLLTRWLTENPGEKLRLLGVVLSDLSAASQLDLFDDSLTSSGRVDAALDEARARFGSRALRRGNTIK